jgi:hypothetical protein
VFVCYKCSSCDKITEITFVPISLYNVWLQTMFPLVCVSRPALRPTQPPIQWVPEVLSQGQSAAGAWCWPLTPIYCRGKEWVGTIFPLPFVALVAAAGQVYFLICQFKAVQLLQQRDAAARIQYCQWFSLFFLHESFNVYWLLLRFILNTL